MAEPLNCDRCGDPIPRVMGIPDMHGDNVLNITISGGYSQFIDSEPYSQPEAYTRLMICHKCGHEFMTGFMNIPASEYSSWHPKTKDDYCEGWK